MNKEEWEKFNKFKNDGQPELEEDLSKICCPWTKDFAHMIQLFQIMTEGLNFNEPFRIEINYDPEQARTVVHRYVNKSG